MLARAQTLCSGQHLAIVFCFPVQQGHCTLHRVLSNQEPVWWLSSSHYPPHSIQAQLHQLRNKHTSFLRSELKETLPSPVALGHAQGCSTFPEASPSRFWASGCCVICWESTVCSLSLTVQSPRGSIQTGCIPVTAAPGHLCG